MKNEINLKELENISFSGLTAEEKETAINWYYGDKTVVLSTSDNTVLTRLKKIARNSPNHIKIRKVNCAVDGTPYGITVELTKKLVKIVTKIPDKREMTDEERAKISERFHSNVLSKRGEQ